MSGSTHEKPEVRDSDKMNMLEAAMDSDTDEVMKYIREGRVHVDDYDDDRVTALQVAAATGNVQLVTALLEHGADIDFCNQVGMTAFHQACREGNLKVIEVLLQRGADIHRLTYLGSSALTLAASGGHDQIVKKLINLTIKPSSCDGHVTPLIAAAFRGNAVSLSHLVKIGKAQINEIAERLYNLSPLTCAVLCSNRPMIACLLELEADPHHVALRGKSAMWLADYQKRVDIVELFRDHTSKRKIPTETKDLRQLILEGDLAKMKQSIKRKEVVPDVPPTVFSTLAGNLTALRCMLVELEQPVAESEPKLALDSLMVAALLRDHDFCELLLSNGASTNAMNSLGQTAWDLYLSSFEEADDGVRLALSTYSPKKQSVLPSAFFRNSGGSSSSSISKMFSSSKHKFGDRSDSHSSAIRMREMYEMRKATWPMVGRNHRKLLLAGDLILGRREWVKRREKHNLNRLIDVARSLAEESQSFAAVCFYDVYNRDTEPRSSQNLDTEQLPKDVLDLAVFRSSSYGYRGRNKEPQQPAQTVMYAPIMQHRSPYSSSRFMMTRSPGVSGSGDPLLDVPQQTRIRRSETTGGGTPHRTTPRMIKKSRDSISSVDSLGSVRSLAISSSSLTPLDESSTTLRSFRSTPHLVGVVPPRRNSPYSTRVTRGESLATGSMMNELKRIGLARLVDIFHEQEVDEHQLIYIFGEKDFFEMGITARADIDALKEIQMKFKFGR